MVGRDRDSKTVFRLRQIQPSIETYENVAELLSSKLGVSAASIRVFSLATLGRPQGTSFKVATLMFTNVPHRFKELPHEDEWVIGDLLLDVNFMGLTPLNDLTSAEHKSNCIAISGLGSHPFGSWQQKQGDKTFMWLRDKLPNLVPHTRSWIYGYDTTLQNSQSVQEISDIAGSLRQFLNAYGWDSEKAKPTAFLAHSLGGLVLKQMLIMLAETKKADGRLEYNKLFSNIKGAIFFGVPNNGMKDQHLRAIVGDNPNKSLVSQLGEGSDFVKRVSEAFQDNCIMDIMECFWVYETRKSPTAKILQDDRVDRNGTPDYLVARDSATCGFVRTNPSVTFAIDATHSDIVKFGPGSPSLEVVRSKLCSILSSFEDEDMLQTNFTECNSQPGKSSASTDTIVQNGLGPVLEASVEKFKRDLAISPSEALWFEEVCEELIWDYIRDKQAELERTYGVVNLARLGRFLKATEELLAISKNFFDPLWAVNAIWGSIKYICDISSALPSALHSILDAFEEVGLSMPLLEKYADLFHTKSFMRQVLILLYDDILGLMKTLLSAIRHRRWQFMFEALWQSVQTEIIHIKRNMGRNWRVLEDRATLPEFEAILNRRQRAMDTSKREAESEKIVRQKAVHQWLSALSWEDELDQYRETRSICRDPGRWLLDHKLFHDWVNTETCSWPIIWLSGKPGAGKTILASVLIDEVKKSRVVSHTVAFFFCKHGDKLKNSFVAMAKSLLAQILSQNDELLAYFHEEASSSGDAVLKQRKVCSNMLKQALNSCEKTYLIIDGLDECVPGQPREIVGWFKALIDDLPPDRMNSLRCLFVSQEDPKFDFPTIKVTPANNHADLQNCITVWHRQIEHKFGAIPLENAQLPNILMAKAQGMFIFAQLMAKYLENLDTMSALLKELQPGRLPVNLDRLYSRILERVFYSKDKKSVKNIHNILGLIVCAKRPLRWQEVQSVISLELEEGIATLRRDKSMIESPKGLFAALVEVKNDSTVELVHGTAREFLIRSEIVQVHRSDYLLTVRCLLYLAALQFDLNRGEIEISKDIASGIFTFYDYASACWGMHLQSTVSGKISENRLHQLQQSLESLVEQRWSNSSKMIPIPSQIEKSFSFLDESDKFGEILLALAWYNKQISDKSECPTQNEALSLWQITERSRAVLEKMMTQNQSSEELQEMKDFYGTKWFKCPRINCFYYYQGFHTAQKRDSHIAKHDRPFLCNIRGCHMASFGFSKDKDLQRHKFDYHGLGDAERICFPTPPIDTRTLVPQAATEKKFHCELCNNSYTRNHSLKEHMRKHEGLKPHSCAYCGNGFTRNKECKRHEQSCSNNPQRSSTCICQGSLEDGSEWGCKKSFPRPDSLARHLQSKTGRKCIQPFIEQNLRNSTDGDLLSGETIFANEVGPNSEMLQAAGCLLPPFKEFLQMCGLDNFHTD